MQTRSKEDAVVFYSLNRRYVLFLLVSRLNPKKGDNLFVIETKQGIELTPYDPEMAAQMEAAKRVMREDRDVLRKLAE